MKLLRYRKDGKTKYIECPDGTDVDELKSYLGINEFHDMTTKFIKGFTIGNTYKLYMDNFCQLKLERMTSNRVDSKDVDISNMRIFLIQHKDEITNALNSLLDEFGPLKIASGNRVNQIWKTILPLGGYKVIYEGRVMFGIKTLIFDYADD